MPALRAILPSRTAGCMLGGMTRPIRRAGGGQTTARVRFFAVGCALSMWTVASPPPAARADPAPATQPAPADDSLAADLKTVADPEATEDEAEQAPIRLGESLDGPLPDLTLAALLRQATYPDEQVRRRAMHVLGIVGPPAEAAVPELVRIA